MRLRLPRTDIDDHEANHPSGGGGTVSTDATIDGDGSQQAIP